MLNFPNSPQVGDSFSGSGHVWSWDGAKWNEAIPLPVDVVLSGASWRGPFPHDNIAISEDGLSLANFDLGAQHDIAIGNGAFAEGDALSASVAIGYRAGRKFTGRTATFIGHVAGEYVGASSSSTFLGGYCGRGFETHNVTGADISGAHPLSGNDNTGTGEACMISIIGDAGFNSGYGFNSLFSLSYGKLNTAYGFATGMMITGVSGDSSSNSLNSMFGSSAYRYGNGKQNTMLGALAGLGLIQFSTLAAAVSIGDFVIPVADTTEYAIGNKVFSGSFLKSGTSVTAVTPGGGGLIAPAGTITVDIACWGDIADGVPSTIYSFPNQHTGTGCIGVGYNALADMVGAASYNIGLGVSTGGGVSGDDNLFIMRSAGSNATTGSKNIIIAHLGTLETAADSQTLNIGNTIRGTGINGGSAGNIGINVMPSLIAARLHVGGGILATSTIMSNLGASTGGIGYAVGAGGTITQTTNKSTSAGLTKPCGQVVTHGASLAAGETVSFLLTNNSIAATDVVIANIASGGTVNAYDICVTEVSTGQARVQYTNKTAGALAETLTINFAILKAVAA